VNSEEAHFLNRVFERFAEDLHSFVRRRVGADAAPDIVQETYLHWLKLTGVETLRDPRAFLFTIAANLSRDTQRKEENRSKYAARDIDLSALVSPLPSPEDAAEWSARFQCFREALAELPELQRHAFLLNRFRGLTHPETAKRLGLSQKTVERYIRQATEYCATRVDLTRD
jgi:RNA polymerase sigma-70 factor (ECF subfamily)